MDPRVYGARENLRSVKRILAVVSGKGGVGKSVFSVSLALSLRGRGSVGLLDLDFWGPSAHVILGADIDLLPEEERGVVPPEVSGMRFLSVAYYCKDRPLTIRGPEYTDALLEILAVARWGDLDFLVVDMPPGLSDPFLDSIRFLKDRDFIVISTPSPVSVSVVERVLVSLSEVGIKAEGIVENMSSEGGSALTRLAERFDIPLLGKIPFDPSLEGALGNVEKLVRTRFFEATKGIALKVAGEVEG